MSLSGRKVLVTRQKEQSAEVTRLLKMHGADVYVVPYIETRRTPAEWPTWEMFDYVVLTSANTVRFLRDGNNEIPANIQILAVGERTAAAVRDWLPNRKIAVPKRFDGQGILEWFLALGEDTAKLRIMCPQAKQARAVFVAPLKSLGAQVETLEIYSIEMKKHDVLPEKSITDVLFFSGRTIDAFFASHEIALEYLNDRNVAVIGRNTREHAENLGINSVICPTSPELDLLVEALLDKVVNNCDDNGR